MGGRSHSVSSIELPCLFSLRRGYSYHACRGLRYNYTTFFSFFFFSSLLSSRLCLLESEVGLMPWLSLE